MLYKNLFICSLVLMMTACASLMPPSAPVPLQANLREPCPDLPPLIDGSAAAALRWSVATAKQYLECQASQARGVQAVGTQ